MIDEMRGAHGGVGEEGGNLDAIVMTERRPRSLTIARPEPSRTM